MNKRLREFEQESKLEIFGLGAKRHIWEAALEKYAELIVQECAKVCDLYAMPDGTSETAIILAYAIRRKFGVEE
jgi:hypothetical protein